MNKKELFELIKTGEGYTLEFKQDFNSSIGKSICAFANASGGKIFLGVSDENKIIGFKNNNKIFSEIQTIARNMDPSFQINFEMVDNIGVIYVPEGKDKPYSVSGKYYLRQGANSQCLNRDELNEFFQKNNKISFERQIPNLNLTEDFDKSKFEFFRTKAKIPLDLSIGHVLKNLNLLTEDKPNNACALLFSNRITKFFLSGDIVCILYKGNSKLSMLDKKEFNADFISNFDNAFTFVMRNIRLNASIKGQLRVETPEIPKEAIREAILNAMIHKDYFVEGRILINIFDNKVEILNPGKLLFKEDELGEISITRNPILADCISRAGYVERIGSGIKRIKELVPNVKFETSSDWFKVIFVRKILEKSDTNRTQIGHKSDTKIRQKWILEYLEKTKIIKTQDIMTEFNVVKDTAIRDLNELISQKKIIKKGSGRNVWYELI
ncbi:MAG: putative DNA binding domain-containing protein [Candidatus Nanoarchaeia archaeon]|nr:putative DNA binding domain-containing protein [Candidatus Nanoarchaeia archaeon]